MTMAGKETTGSLVEAPKVVWPFDPRHGLLWVAERGLHLLAYVPEQLETLPEGQAVTCIRPVKAMDKIED
jgi:hypothetical protein